jgi:hypothetical protein
MRTRETRNKVYARENGLAVEGKLAAELKSGRAHTNEVA